MKKFIGISLGILLIVGFFGSYFLFGTYSKGKRAGQLMKLSEKGFIFKTWEGQLNVGGLQDADGSGTSSTIWSYSVKDEKVVEQIYALMEDGSRARLTYEEKFFTLPWWGDTHHFITKVEAVKGPSIN